MKVSANFIWATSHLSPNKAFNFLVIIFQLHVDLTIREIAKFHAISYCMSSSSSIQSNDLDNKYSLLNKDSIYRPDTYQVWRRMWHIFKNFHTFDILGHQKSNNTCDGWLGRTDKSFSWLFSILLLVYPSCQGECEKSFFCKLSFCIDVKLFYLWIR